MKLAVFDCRGTAFEALRMLHNNGVVEAKVWPAAPEAGAFGPYVVTVAKSRIQHARELLLQSGLLNLTSSAV
jgi:hypothetical protein